MCQEILDSVLKAAGYAVQMLRNSKIGAYVYPVVPSEYTNWRDEQRAWRESAVLFDQSHHMAEFTVKGPDALKLMSYCTINSFNNFAIGKAKQMVPISYDGYVIGDGILFYEDKDELVFVLAACADRELAAVPGRNRDLQGRHDPRRPLAFGAARQGRDPPSLSFPDPGPGCLESDREAQRRPGS